MLLSLGRRVTTGASSYSLNGASVVSIVGGAGSFSLYDEGNSSANPTLNGIPTTLSP